MLNMVDSSKMDTLTIEPYLVSASKLSILISRAQPITVNFPEIAHGFRKGSFAGEQRCCRLAVNRKNAPNGPSLAFNWRVERIWGHQAGMGIKSRSGGMTFDRDLAMPV